MNILSVENASFAVGHVALLDKTSFQLDSGEKIGLMDATVRVSLRF